jgi:hypothetical protein
MQVQPRDFSRIGTTVAVDKRGKHEKRFGSRSDSGGAGDRMGVLDVCRMLAKKRRYRTINVIIAADQNSGGRIA